MSQASYIQAIVKRKDKPADDPASTTGGAPGLPGGLDRDADRILRQSIPAEPVTRDFLEELLQEHRANQKKNDNAK